MQTQRIFMLNACYRDEGGVRKFLLGLRARGATYEMIRARIRADTGIKVGVSTLHGWLEKWNREETLKEVET